MNLHRSFSFFNYAVVVAVRDFQCGLNEMYGINWTRIHKKIYRHEKVINDTPLNLEKKDNH